jgi:hypothetical protein
MSQSMNPGTQGAPKAAPNVYTVLMLVAIVAMAASTVVVLMDLLSPTGYGLQFGDLFTDLPTKLVGK